MEKYLELGQIVNVRGLKGEVKVNPFTDNPKKFETFKRIIVKNKSEKEYEIEKVGYNKNQVILKLKGVDRVEDAENLRGSYILIDRENLAPLPEGTYYIADLIGLDVYLEDGTVFGKIEYVFNTGANDVYEVRDVEGRLRYLPAIDEVRKEINLKEHKMVIHLVEGL
jgi:16S rRNA processing protein RimM